MALHPTSNDLPGKTRGKACGLFNEQLAACDARLVEAHPQVGA